MTTRELLTIGLDLGTSSLKAVAVGENGRCVARARVGYPTAQPELAAAEQDPADWIDACRTAVDTLAQRTDPSSWRAIALSGMLPTLVNLGPGGVPVGPALTWQDGRAEPDGEQIAAAIGAETLYRRTGQRFDGRYLIAMHRRRVRLGVTPADSVVAGAKDYLYQVLTGELLTDPSTAAGYGAYDLHDARWDDATLAAAQVTEVPALAPSDTRRPLRAELAARWGCPVDIPVLLGAADSVLGAYGLGVRHPGPIAYIAGTSNVILGRSATLQLDDLGRFLVTPMEDNGFGLEMDLLATGSAVQWLAGLLGLDSPAALGDLADAAELSSAPMVLPYLSPGEQGALWDPGLRGATEGLTLRTTPAELARGLLAGIVAESRRCIDVLTHATATPGPILVTGSGGTPMAFRRDLADATDRAVHFHGDERDHCALGAALFAGRQVLDWPAGQVSEIPAEVIEPDSSRADLWAQRFAAHDALRLSQQERHR
ncbi:xylulokinase [Mycolicibacterium sarraceniae]|uniref:Xylulokinase n=1 Tax=Mycolicibacterium sarraceniae TaxID=1534348 RepID=A0A7I7SQA4_9MYCO|nr:FGGY-family carbohydrate kinase [Mycolicibacterium sarraceniae]BBY58319.1 xylulokinase [Mycolicibacterium sarraceniae]